MKAVVITLVDNKYSANAAEKTIRTAKHYGVEVTNLPACDASKVDIYNIFKMNDLPHRNFVDQWSKADKSMACFFSHYSAWAIAEAIKQPLMILEHDAVFKSYVKTHELKFKSILNIGKPSYGKFRTTEKTGVQPFFSNSQGYLKGAHAYIVTPDAASKLIKLSKDKAYPADLFINTKNFPDMEELSPWPVVVEETASTVQNDKGARAKHAYTKDYKII